MAVIEKPETIFPLSCRTYPAALRSVLEVEKPKFATQYAFTSKASRADGLDVPKGVSLARLCELRPLVWGFGGGFGPGGRAAGAPIP
ncbi:hypothetical protein [Mesorhizobium sp. M0208]|uniref:hypothetical protein n=2 Tax=Mesorhizobium TaxID=68287 RepID=UPI0033389DA0